MYVYDVMYMISCVLYDVMYVYDVMCMCKQNKISTSMLLSTRLYLLGFKGSNFYPNTPALTPNFKKNYGQDVFNMHLDK